MPTAFKPQTAPAHLPGAAPPSGPSGCPPPAHPLAGGASPHCGSLLKPACSVRMAGRCSHPRWLGRDTEAGLAVGLAHAPWAISGQAPALVTEQGAGQRAPVCPRFAGVPGRRCLGECLELGVQGSGPCPALPLPCGATWAHIPLSRFGPSSLVKVSARRQYCGVGRAWHT